MLKLIVSLVTVQLIALNSAQARDLRRVSCTGFVSFEEGTMQGRLTVTVQREGNGEWVMNDHISLGRDQSLDSNSLQLDSYGGWFNCQGGTAEYDVLRRTLKFRYKYDSGILGGGCQKTRGEFTDCQQE